MLDSIVKKWLIRSEELKTHLWKDKFSDFIIMQQLIIIYTELTPEGVFKKYFWENISAIHFIYLLRHIFVHFPIFSNIDDIYITLDMLKGGKSKQWKLEEFLKSESRSDLLKYSINETDYYFTISVPILSEKNGWFKLMDIIQIIKWDELKEADKLYLCCIILWTIFQNYCRERQIIPIKTKG